MAQTPSYFLGRPASFYAPLLAPASASVAWGDDEYCRLLLLRARYQATRDLFSREELARLCFVRWLRLTP